jgi:hypothetical protein
MTHDRFFHDKGFIVHVQDGRHYIYLAHRGEPYGAMRGPYRDAEAAEQAGRTLRLLMQRQRRALRAHLFSTSAIAGAEPPAPRMAAAA